jgi:hypothetical protein
MSGHFRRRGKRQEQQIALIRKLWEQPVVDHEDSDHRIDRAGILPVRLTHLKSHRQRLAARTMTDGTAPN